MALHKQVYRFQYVLEITIQEERGVPGHRRAKALARERAVEIAARLPITASLKPLTGGG